MSCSGGVGDSGGLVDAINSANAGGGGTISLAAGCTYALTQVDNYWYGPNALPPIQAAIVIDGNGATLEATHSGDPTPTTANAFRFFYISGGMESPAGSLTLQNLTLRGGYAKGGDSNYGGDGAGMGGAIFNQGTLNLVSVTLYDNTAQGGNTNRNSQTSGGGGMGQDAPADNSGGGFGGVNLPGRFQMLSAGGAASLIGGGGGGGFLRADNGEAAGSGGNGGGSGQLGGAGGYLEGYDLRWLWQFRSKRRWQRRLRFRRRGNQW